MYFNIKSRITGLKILHHGLCRHIINVLCILTILIGIPTFILSSTDAHAGRIEFPPGIANCRDSVIKDAYELYHQNYLANWGGNRNRPTKDIAIGMLNLGGDAHAIINRDTPFKEPAYYFLAEKMDVGRATPSFEKIKLKNEPLAFFADAMNKFFTTWVRKRKDFSWAVADNFFKSILTAAGERVDPGSRPEDRFERLSVRDKNSTIKALVKRIKKNKNYDQRLAAAWSIRFLRYHVIRKHGINSDYAKALEIAKNEIPSLIGYKLHFKHWSFFR